MANPPIISVRNVSKVFPGAPSPAVDDVSLDIMAGEFFALLGPSGCGKTTLLRMIAGFELPSAGQILIDGKDMADVPPNRRPVNMVFQSYAVFPHMSVAKNVGYGLKVAGVAADDIKTRVDTALDLVKLGGLGHRRPDQLSGGQRQRVALARSLVMQPKVLLLDEPLSALDAKLRAAMQFELAELQNRVGITFVTVTHDQDEALSMAQRIAVMERGNVAQLASPNELYEHPANRFVADFVGSVNIFEGRLAPGGGEVDCAALGKLRVSQGAAPNTADGALWVAIRPEKIALQPADDADATPHNQTTGVIRGQSYLGDITIYEVRLDSGADMRVSRPNLSRTDQQSFAPGHRVAMTWREESPVLLSE